ncbi:MAG: rod shape-determining protein MreC [Alphaproteobacteria bacterium]|nr:rod shape-determining protein MreC [Alphaproteobacteria bacterium]
MKRRGASVARLAHPAKIWVQRILLMLMVGTAVGLILIADKEKALVEELRTTATDAFAPVLEIVSAPVETATEAFESLGQLASLQGENSRLRAENERLLKWEAVARRLEAENRAFRSMLNFVPEQAFRYISARVIADSSGAFVRSMLLDAGARDGIGKGQAAISGEGLVGRVAEVGDNTARVLLVTDLNSRIPVRLETSRDRGMLAGDNSDRPRLIYLPPNARVVDGDRIVTSGDGGVFPPGLAVGTVGGLEDGVIRIDPFVNWNRLEYVRVIDLNPLGIVGRDRRRSILNIE